MKAPNGWISHDLYIWNELDRRGFVSKGFVLEIPDLRHGSDHALDSFHESVRQFLHTLEESTRAQFRWSVDADYREELLSYKRITDERCEPDSWAAITRNERFNRYWQAMQSGRLRREKLVLFLSKRITTNPPASADKQLLADHYRRVLHQFNEAFDQHRRVIASLFEPHGCRVTSMSTEDLFRYFATLSQSLLPQAGELRPDSPVQAGGNHPPELLAPGRPGRAELRVLRRRILSQSRHPQAPSAAHAARPFLGADLAAVPRLLDHRQSLPAQRPQGNRPHGKVPGTRAR